MRSSNSMTAVLPLARMSGGHDGHQPIGLVDRWRTTGGLLVILMATVILTSACQSVERAGERTAWQRSNQSAENASLPERERILDFLRKLRAVIEHDDLGDREFIERTLNVKLVPKRIDLVDKAKVWLLIRSGQESFDVTNLPIDVARLLSDDPLRATQYYSKSTAEGKYEVGIELIFPFKDARSGCIRRADVRPVFGQPDGGLSQDRPTALETDVYRFSKRNHVVAHFSSDLMTYCMAAIRIVQNRWK